MIIVSQDKKSVVNSRIMNIIEIFNYGTKSGLRAENRDDTYVLAIYDTEERAKEVLQEIVETFTNEEFFHIRKSSLNNLDELAEPKYILKPVSRPKVYEMPEE